MLHAGILSKYTNAIKHYRRTISEPDSRTETTLSRSHNCNKTEMIQFYFSKNVLAVLANYSRYPLFMAWRANSADRL